MARDPLSCSPGALVDQADFTARQIAGTATLLGPGALVATLPELQRLAADARRLLATTRASRVRVKGPYLDAKAVMARVVTWVADLRLQLDGCDGDPEGARLAAQVRASLRADLRRVSGNVTMLTRTQPLLRRLAAGLSPWLDAAGAADAIEPDRAALVTLQDARSGSVDAQVGTTRSYHAVQEDLRRLMRKVRRLWRRAALTNPALPSMDLTIAYADVASARPRPTGGDEG